VEGWEDWWKCNLTRLGMIPKTVTWAKFKSGLILCSMFSSKSHFKCVVVVLFALKWYFSFGVSKSFRFNREVRVLQNLFLNVREMQVDCWQEWWFTKSDLLNSFGLKKKNVAQFRDNLSDYCSDRSFPLLLVIHHDRA